MLTVSAISKNLNRVSRQVKSWLGFVLLLLTIMGAIQVFYTSLTQEPELQEVLVASPKSTPLPSPEILSTGLEAVQISRVVDGDTIRLEDGRTLRYIGINTPETVAPQKPVECFGKEASDFNRSLVEGKTVWLEKDVSETDRYGRLLRYVYLDQNASLSAQVNYLLVAQGYAYASSYPPDVKWQIDLQAAQKNAELATNGLWSTCHN